MVFTQSAKAVH